MFPDEVMEGRRPPPSNDTWKVTCRIVELQPVTPSRHDWYRCSPPPMIPLWQTTLSHTSQSTVDWHFDHPTCCSHHSSFPFLTGVRDPFFPQFFFFVTPPSRVTHRKVHPLTLRQIHNPPWVSFSTLHTLKTPLQTVTHRKIEYPIDSGIDYQ